MSRNKKNNLKKLILLIMILLVIILIILLSYLHFTSEEYVLRLLNKGINNVNYSYINSDNTKIQVIRNVEKIIYEDGTILYNNYDTGESVEVAGKDGRVTEFQNNGKNSGPHYIKYVQYMEDENYEYIYEGTEKINNEKCVVISYMYINKGDDGSQLKQKIWVNKELGTIEKIASYVVKDDKETLLSESTYNMHTNDVTESDIAKP